LSTLKIFTGAKPFQKAGIKPFGITEIEMLPHGVKPWHGTLKKGLKKGWFYFSFRKLFSYYSDWFSYILFGQTLMEKDIRYVRSAIEDLAFTSCSLRVLGRAGLLVCIEQCFMFSVMSGEQLKTF
jgi:hypothetical protein